MSLTLTLDHDGTRLLARALDGRVVERFLVRPDEAGRIACLAHAGDGTPLWRSRPDGRQPIYHGATFPDLDAARRNLESFARHFAEAEGVPLTVSENQPRRRGRRGGRNRKGGRG